MSCVICKQGETHPGHTSLTLERGRSVLVMRGVPADVCENCGEAYLRADAVDHALRTLDALSKAGVELEIRDFAAA